MRIKELEDLRDYVRHHEMPEGFYEIEKDALIDAVAINLYDLIKEQNPNWRWGGEIPYIESGDYFGLFKRYEKRNFK